jgi:methylase of polypeptide subunit release factors
VTDTVVPVETIDFGGLRIDFDTRVLRPRPWTTAQSRWAAELAEDKNGDGRVLELCSGAGHIGLLAVAGSRRQLVCVDIDPVAASYTRANAAANGLADRVEVRESPMLDALSRDELFPVIIADPPWVPSDETVRFPEDPLLAIDGGVGGMQVALHCLRVMLGHLQPGGAAVIQLGTLAQAAEVSRLLDGTRLVPGELREYDGRGVLLRLDQLPASGSVVV